MGTVRWDLASYGKVRGSGAASVIGELVNSGAHTSSTSASNLTDGAAGAGSAVTAPVGTVLRVVSDEVGRLVIGGGTATASSGYLLEANVARDIEITTAGTISVIDEA